MWEKSDWDTREYSTCGKSLIGMLENTDCLRRPETRLWRSEMRCAGVSLFN